MKKKILTVVLIILLSVCMVGCGKSKEENKQEKSKNINQEITEYFKYNLDSSWSYSEEKFKIDENQNIEVIYNNIPDWSYCGYTTNTTILNLNKENENVKKVSSITFICKNDGSEVSRVVYNNIKNIDKDNIVNNFKIYVGDSEITESIESGFKNSCVSYKYKEIFRNPDQYVGKRAKITGEVIQVMEEKNDGIDYWTLRVDMTKTNLGYEDTIIVVIPKSSINGRIIEDDTFTFYGVLTEPITYETVLGASQTVPAIVAYYGELHD